MTMITIRVKTVKQVFGAFGLEVNRTQYEYYTGDVSADDLQSVVLKWKLERGRKK